MILHQEGPRHVGPAVGERSRRLSVWRWWEGSGGSVRDSDSRASVRAPPRAFFRWRPVVRCEVRVARGNFHRSKCWTNNSKCRGRGHRVNQRPSNKTGVWRTADAPTPGQGKGAGWGGNTAHQHKPTATSERGGKHPSSLNVPHNKLRSSYPNLAFK